ncbi:MAG: hypothetical protein ACI9NC_006410, partial [Verrucomicrobiales bacterium]
MKQDLLMTNRRHPRFIFSLLIPWCDAEDNIESRLELL